MTFIYEGGCSFDFSYLKRIGKFSLMISDTSYILFGVPSEINVTGLCRKLLYTINKVREN